MVSFTLYNKLYFNSSMRLYRFIDRQINRFRALALAVLHCWLTLGCVGRPTDASGPGAGGPVTLTAAPAGPAAARPGGRRGLLRGMKPYF